MSEPLFLQSVMQEKIWGGTHLRDVFGYDIPSHHVGKYWTGLFQPTQMVCLLSKMVVMLSKLWTCFMQSIVNCLAIVRKLSSHF